MHDKNYDGFFDEATPEDRDADALMKMIDSYDKKVRTDLKVGTRVTGKVTRIGTEYVFVDVGGKNEALIKRTEYTDNEGTLGVKEGDEVTAFVVSESASETMLSKSLGGHSAAMTELMDAMNGKMPIQGKVTGINKGGINVKIMGHRAFCPASQIEIKYVEDINRYLNKTLSFVITRITEGGRNIVLSRIPLLEGELENRIVELEKAIEERRVLKGRISRITDFGLFVDIGDLEGLVHISEISWERAENIAETYSVGQDVEFVVLRIERKQPLRNSKVSLSIKQVLDDPWKTISTRITIGQSIEGTVTRIANFGAFVEIAPGIEGLVHISEMSWVKRVNHPSEAVAPGNRVRVIVLSIDESKKTVSLSLKDVADDPWRDADTRFAPGSDVSGTIAKKTRYGYFIDIAEGVTGLLPFANIASEKKDAFRENDTITVHVENVDKAQRRISLSFGMKEATRDATAVQDYIRKQTAPQQQKPASTEFGTALLEALRNKK